MRGVLSVHQEVQFCVIASQTARCQCVSPHLARTSHLIQQVFALRRKAVPLQAWTGPEGSRKLRFPDYVTTAQDGGKVVSLTHRPPLPPGNASGTYFC